MLKQRDINNGVALQGLKFLYKFVTLILIFVKK